MQMAALRRLVTEEFVASHFLSICYKRTGKGRKLKIAIIHCPTLYPAGKERSSRSLAAPRAESTNEAKGCSSTMEPSPPASAGGSPSQAGRGHLLMAADTSCTLKIQDGNTRVEMERYHGHLQN